MMMTFIDDILASPIKNPTLEIGQSREGRSIYAGKYGNGKQSISLIAGCHADEPVGPRLLRKLCTYLQNSDATHPLLRLYSWYIVPHCNPDGEAINARWYSDSDEWVDLIQYLRYADRELPGNDVEFSFPKNESCSAQRQECRAVYDFWKTSKQPFSLHASLHGMMIASGPWFLIDRDWIQRSEIIQRLCNDHVNKMNYHLHDIDRNGEKGFTRIARGYCTRPDSRAMITHFINNNDQATAAKFYPSSMESIRQISEDCLTLVSEMPLFTVPPLKDISWPNQQWIEWKSLLSDWKMSLLSNGDEKTVRKAVENSVFKAMPISDQMRLQWRFITAGLETVK